MNNNTQQFITTVRELDKHVGEIIFCFFYKDNLKEELGDNFSRPYDEDNILLMWAFKYEGRNRTPKTSIRNVRLFGKDEVYLIDRLGGVNHKPRYTRETAECSAQAYIKLPTKEELIKYQNILRHKRIFGK